MANKRFLFGILAIALVFGMAAVGCDSGSGGNSITPQTVTYIGVSDGITYSLKITENTSRYAAQPGDSYELTAGAKKSTGKVNAVSGGVLTLKPSNSDKTFTVTISESSLLTGFTGSIKWDGDTTETKLPNSLTTNNKAASGGGGGGGGGSVRPIPQELVSTNGEYKIIIKENLSRAYKLQDGDLYEIWKGSELISSGYITNIASSSEVTTTFTFIPNTTKNPQAQSFDATFQFGVLTIDGPITGADGTTVNLPVFSVPGYEGGVADKDPTDTGSTIAGIAYSNSESQSGTRSWSSEHYRITGASGTAMTYKGIKSVLETAWGPANEDTEKGDECNIGMSTTLSNNMKKGEVLFEIYIWDDIPTGGSSYPSKSYRLAEWVTITTGSISTGAWNVAIWYDWNTNITTPPSESGANQIGPLTYAEKDSSSDSYTYDWTNYILDDPYDDALAKLIDFWRSNPSKTFLSIVFIPTTESALTSRKAVFVKTNYNYSYVTYDVYTLARYKDGTKATREMVGWQKQY